MRKNSDTPPRRPVSLSAVGVAVRLFSVCLSQNGLSATSNDSLIHAITSCTARTPRLSLPHDTDDCV